MKLVNQINDQSCVHACIAMVTGKSVEEMWERYPKALNAAQELTLLIESKIFLSRYTPQIGNPVWLRGVYFITAPSLNLDGVMHRLLVEVGDEFTVYDPQAGREGKKFYQSDCMNPDTSNPIKGYSEIDMLDFNALADLRLQKDVVIELPDSLIRGDKLERMFNERWLREQHQHMLGKKDIAKAFYGYGLNDASRVGTA